MVFLVKNTYFWTEIGFSMIYFLFYCPKIGEKLVKFAKKN